jgi:hypothetical protein
MPLRRHDLSWLGPVVLALLACAGCNQKQKPKAVEVERLLHEQSSHRFYTAHYTCQQGEGDWEYICQVRFEPTALSKGRRIRQRVGIRLAGYYEDKPQFAESVLPDDNSVPTLEELSALRHREAAAAAEKTKKRLAEAVR